MKGKLRPYPSGGAVGAVARGEADLVLIGIAAIVDMGAAELVGWLPAELQSYIVYAGSIGVAAKQSQAARTLLSLLTSSHTASSRRHAEIAKSLNALIKILPPRASARAEARR
jgi:ABC-type molybdate transport system substrate-binding protein